MKISPAPNYSTTPALAGRAVGCLLAGLAVAGLLLAGVGRQLRAQDAVPPVVPTVPAVTEQKPVLEKSPESPAPSAADQASLGQAKNFFVPDYYDSPNQNQMKSLLRGAEAQPQPNGHVLIKELQLETYATDGKPVMIVRAPDCNYDQFNQVASSPNHIEASSGDGKMFIEGVGFRWEQTNSLFSISNSVHTTIRQGPDITAAP